MVILGNLMFHTFRLVLRNFLNYMSSLEREGDVKSLTSTRDMAFAMFIELEQS